MSDSSWILLGATRGLGQAFAQILHWHNKNAKILIAARKADWKMNFADQEKWPEYLSQILQKKSSRIIYFAGGGPFGSFSSKDWKDHEWAFKVNFEFPAYLIHQLASAKQNQTQQFCIIGSSIAEAAPDPGAASYSAAKHAAVGLVESLQMEDSISFDLRLFSPGYMDTNLLPANAWPRQKVGIVQDPEATAKILLDWLLDNSKRNSHLVIPSDC